jgi:hypothetical protein
MSSSTPDWIAEYQAERERRRKRLDSAKPCVLAALDAARIANVEIGYDGEGDSGQIGAITAKTAAGKPAALEGSVLLNLDGKPRRYCLAEALDAYAWELLAEYHDGFENNEGGYGIIDIDVAKGSVTIDHNDRIIEVSNTVTEV